MPAIPGLAPPLEALCIAPFGMEEGTEADLPPHEFGVVVGEPVHFRFFASRVRRDDGVGTRLEYWADDEMEELEQIEITLGTEHHPAGQVVPVRLAARVTEVGTLQLEAVARDGQERWKVEFNVRATDPASQSDSTDAMVAEASFAAVSMAQPESQSAESADAAVEQAAVPPSVDEVDPVASGNTERKGRWPFRI
jgi:hypothetical protein